MKAFRVKTLRKTKKKIRGCASILSKLEKDLDYGYHEKRNKENKCHDNVTGNNWTGREKVALFKLSKMIIFKKTVTDILSLKSLNVYKD